VAEQQCAVEGLAVKAAPSLFIHMTRSIYTPNSRYTWAELLNPTTIARSLANNRGLIIAYCKRQFSQTYRGSFLGLAWLVISPLIMLAIYTVIFGFIFKMRFNHHIEETKVDFALALFIGLGFYTFISTAVAGAVSSLTANAVYVKSLNFPIEVIPMGVIWPALVNLLISLGIVLVGFVMSHGTIHLSSIYILPLLFCAVLAGLGCAWWCAALGVFIPDLPSILQPLLAVLMTVSAIFFPMSAAPEKIRFVFDWNPLAQLIDQARQCLMVGAWPNFTITAALILLALLIFISGYAAFMRLKRVFADVL
jgi:lipopolysaccharide transport system permease protein